MGQIQKMLCLGYILWIRLSFGTSVNISDCSNRWNCLWEERVDPRGRHQGDCFLWEPNDPFFRPYRQPPRGPIDVTMECTSRISTGLVLPAPQVPLFECLSLMVSPADLHHLTINVCSELEINEGDLHVFQSLHTFTVTYSSIWSISPRAFCSLKNIVVIELWQDADGTGITEYPDALTGRQCVGQTTTNPRGGEITFLPLLEKLYLFNLQFHATIPVDAFHNIRHLRTLYMYYIFFTNETFQSFKELEGLEIVEIFDATSNNSVDAFLSNAMPYLTNLTGLQISRANLTTVSSLAFSANPALEELDLSRNRLSLVEPGAISGLSNLRSLDISLNSELGANLSSDFLKGANRLEYLSLDGCSITDVINSTLVDAVNLKHLSAAMNQITEIPAVFADLPERDIVLRNIEYIKLSGNRILRVKSFTFSNLPNLEEVDLSSNRIVVVEDQSFYQLKNVGTINLADNFLIRMSTNALFRIADLDRLDLSGNLLTTFPSFPCTVNWERLRDGIPSKRFLTDLRGNALLCDCNMYHFVFEKIIFTGSCYLGPYDRSRFWPGVYDLVNQQFHMNDLQCYVGPLKYKLRDVLLNPVQFVSNIPHGSANYHCPLTCYCYVHCEDGDKVTACNYGNLTSIPPDIDNTTQLLSVTFNRLTRIDRAILTGLTDLIYLVLTDNVIAFIEDNAFEGLVHLRLIDLTNNQLTKINEFTFASASLNELNLSTNAISFIHPKGFSHVPRLHTLNLTENDIEVFPVGVFENLTDISHLFVRGNPINCSCDLLYLSNWYRRVAFEPSRAPLETDFRDIRCAPLRNNASELSRWIDEQEEICSPVPSPDTRTVTLLVTLFVVVIVIVSISIGVSRYWLEIRVLIYSRTGVRCFRPHKEDTDKEYDAFISFSNEDSDFVLNEMLPRLENHSPPWHLCIHHRDFAVGETIATNILNAIEASRRFVIVLSNKFLESEWCSYEFRTAHNQALSEGSRRIILILIDDVNKENLDVELKAYMSTNTYLKVDDTLFWSKLEYALPEPMEPADMTLSMTTPLIPKSPNKALKAGYEIIPT